MFVISGKFGVNGKNEFMRARDSYNPIAKKPARIRAAEMSKSIILFPHSAHALYSILARLEKLQLSLFR